ncbi:MAG: hypothetical protein WA960_08170 [Tunicatimonas sp.]
MMIKQHLSSFYLITALATASMTTAEAQTVIGMGTEQPNPNAVLELVPENGNQGFLAPRLTTAQRQASSFTGKLTRSDNGLLVFDVDRGRFYYWFNGAWRAGTSGGSEGDNPAVSGTTWYTGTTAPSGTNATEGDFYINESTGEVFKFSGNAFVTMGNIKGGAANSPNLTSVLQQGGSAGNQKITDLGAPTDNADAANKQYVDGRETATRAYIDQEILTFPGSTTPSLGQVLGQDNNANNRKITDLADPTNTQDAVTKFYVDNNDNDNQSLDNVLSEGNNANNKQIIGLKDPDNPQDAATKSYVDSEITNATFPSGSVPSLEQVLIQSSNSAANRQIIDLAAPSAANHAVNRKYVDDRDLENALDRDNSAGGKQIVELGSPTAIDHATNRKYVDDQDATLKQYVNDESMISNLSITGSNVLNITEGSATHTVTLPNGGTPANLSPGKFFVGNSSSQPAEVTLTGDISVDADGKVTITNITTAKITNGAVTKEKINADVAGRGLEKNTTTGALDVKVGNGLVLDGGAIRLFNPPAGYLGVGQGTGPGESIQFRPMSRDGTLNADGELTVKGLQGRSVAGNAPLNNQILKWNASANDGNGQWVPATLAEANDRPGTWFSGNYVPSSTSPAEAVDGDFYFHTDDQTVYSRASGSWNAAGDLVSATLITPSTYTGGPAPDNSHPAKVGDFYIRNNGEVFLKVKGNGANQWVQID